MGDEPNSMKPASPEQAVFAEALQRATAEARAAYLDGACGTDTALRRRVEALLRAAESAGDFLEQPPTGLAANDGSTLVVTGISEKPGDRIGRYKLLQQIGEGGCGVVYMAEQEEPVRRRVALKVIKLGMDTKSVIARFEAERQALALMDHPNIAKVLEAGATVTGRPYFVMELVRGIKITDYCDQNNLSTAERLKLFTQVCQAIQHAHQKGIIHRDIKPSNILVTVSEPGSPGSPKVIDFGIAKATTGQRLTDKTVFTAFEQFIGTPAYMSPEQAMMTSLDIDTRTDIYALGVLLYELLTGQTPFDAKDLMAAGLDAMRRIIRETEPPRPSTRLSTLLAADLTIVARHRHAEPGRLGTLLRGDLDWIVMKALEKDRTRRYDTANGLAMDIQRHLSHEPVVARPPSTGYRFQKMVHRNKLAFTAASAVAIALVLGLVVSTWQAIRARRAEHFAEASRVAEVKQRKIAEAEQSNAEKQRKLAEANFQKARETVDEYFTLVSQNTLFEAPGLQPLRMQLLEAARQYYEGFLQQKSDDPEIQAEMAAIYGRLSTIYIGLDRTDDAVSALLASLQIAEKLVSEHPDNKEYPKRLAGFLKGSKAFHKGTRAPKDPVNALLTLQKITALWEKFARDNPGLPGFRSDLILMYTIAGDSLRTAGQRESARTTLQRALEVAEQLLLEHPTVREYEGHFFNAYSRLAGLFNSSGRRTAGEQVFRRGLQVLAKLAADHPDLPGYRADLGRAYGDLAFFLREDGKHGEAEKLYIQAREILEPLAAESPADGNHRHVLSGCHRGLAFVLRDSNRPQEAEVAYRKALAVQEQLVHDFPAVPDYRWEFAATLADLGQLVQTARPQDAEPAYRQALAVHERLVADFPTVDSYQRDLRNSQTQLAGLLGKTGQSEEAEELYRQGLALQRKQLGNDHPNVATALRDLAFFLRDQGKLAEAETLDGEALAIWKRPGNENPDTVESLISLAWELHLQGKPLEVEARAALTVARKVFSNEHPMIGTALERLGTALSDQGKHTEAEAMFRDAVVLRRKVLGEHVDTAHSLAWLAGALEAQGKIPAAEAATRESLEIRKKSPGNESWVVGSLDYLASLLQEQGKTADAETVLRELLALRRSLPADDPQLAATLAELAMNLLVQKKFAEAEPPARECLAIRERKLPDDWRTFNARSMLGGSLLGQKKYAEAEPLLLSGYEGMKQREAKIPAGSKRYVKETLQRIVQLYEATGQSEKAAEWKTKLAAFDQAEAEKKTAVPKP